MFFEDSAVPLDKFPDLSDLFSNNLVERLDRVHLAMEAAGVRPISAVVLGVADKPVNPRECEEVRGPFTERTKLIKAVSEGVTGDGGMPFEDIHFLQADELKMKWKTNFPRVYSTPLEPISAYLDAGKQAIYFTSQGSDYPWLDIAVELTRAIAPGEEISFTASTIMMVLQAATYKDAVLQLKKLHINIPEELGDLASTGAVAEVSEVAPPSDGHQEMPLPPQDDPTSSDTDEPPECDLVSWDEEDKKRDDDARTGDSTETEEPVRDSGGNGDVLVIGNGSGTETVARGRTRGEGGSRRGRSSGGDGGTSGGRQTTRTPRGRGRRPFYTYIGTHPGENEPSPEGSEEAARRMAFEENAIQFILACEPEWERTPTHNPGYDLEKIDHNGVISVCEVKAMTGAWGNGPVGLTHTQFKTAQEYGEAYWLYVVEHADTGSPNIVKIQDPAGKARTFTFDRGWREVADGGDGDAEPSF